MKEEYVEGLIEIPRINEESLPELFQRGLKCHLVSMQGFTLL